jgi:sulfatase maturation enzyme AslB (radical SAM superfamily)
MLRSVAGSLDLLRVSIDGLEQAHDDMRARGSFRNAIQTLKLAAGLGIRTGVTVTVTARNVADVPLLAELVASAGASELKIHQLRLVGNAVTQRIARATDEQLGNLVSWISKHGNDGIKVFYDEDLDPHKNPITTVQMDKDVLDRIELDPDGGLTMSCKAVGTDVQAFYWSSRTGAVEYRPSLNDEIVAAVPQVRYV